VEQARLNLLYMFFNARLQGTTADLSRLGGIHGAKRAAAAWGRLGALVGVPTLALYAFNHSKENREDYEKRSAQEKQNYWLIPKDKYITGDNGEKIRDYWRIPKRESSKWVANMLESALDFAKKKDPANFQKFAVGMLEDISPVNIQGNTLQERMESTGASLNPLIKAPLELATGRDMYRHRDIVPDTMKKASPELQFTDRTPEVFKKLADAMPGVAPEVLRSPLMLENLTKNLTAGLFTQFIPRKKVEGRTDFENQPLMQRFQAIPYTDRKEFDDQMRSLERESADDYLKRHREVLGLMESNKGKDIKELATKAVAQYGKDPKMLNHLVDLWVAEKNGISNEERQLIGLPAKQRASYIASKLSGQTPEVQSQIIENYATKRILTEPVALELAEMSFNIRDIRQKSKEVK
jgi:hypothetical protein